MNAQHKLNRIGNRLRRLARRITELNADKTSEIIKTKEHNRDPNLGNILAAINRLQTRMQQLQ